MPQAVVHTIMKPEELEAFRPKLRVGELKEGYVLHWQVLQAACLPQPRLYPRRTLKALTDSTAPTTATQARNAAGEFVTVGVEKFKLWWYVILRALREYCSNHKGLDEGWETRWADRLRKRNRDYMKLPTGFLAMWYTATAQFIAWFLDRTLPKQVSEPSRVWVLECATQPLEFLLRGAPGDWYWRIRAWNGQRLCTVLEGEPQSQCCLG